MSVTQAGELGASAGLGEHEIELLSSWHAMSQEVQALLSRWQQVEQVVASIGTSELKK